MTPMTNDEIKALMLANGFTIKDGLSDLKPYVYLAARAIEAKAQQAAVPAGFVLAPIKMTPAMIRITDQDDWQWADVLAAAEAITEDQYAASTQGCDAQQVEVPAGYALVPIDPTEEMLKAARNAPIPAVWLDSHTARQNLSIETNYRAMLAAALQPPQGDAT